MFFFKTTYNIKRKIKTNNIPFKTAYNIKKADKT